MKPSTPQSMSVKRAQVEFHNFASLGEPERAAAVYAEENTRRGTVLRNHAGFIGPMTPFLEIGANAGHSSYMLANEFGAQGFALDLSADSLRHGIALQDRWNLAHAPVRMAGDALHLPFRDNSLRVVLAFQMLSQFLDIESVFIEVKRVLAPGGLFIFAEEPLRRLLSLRIYRCPYYENMKWWERKLSDWGLLGYLVRDVIGAHQEEGFGIRQNHAMYMKDWHALITRHFEPHESEMFVPERGWGERVVKNLCRGISHKQFDWLGSTLLGGTLAALCRKPGDAGYLPPFEWDRFESVLRCPDCGAAVARDADEALACTACAYAAPLEGGVYNLLPTESRTELYPGERPDIIDFSQPNHESMLGAGWHELEGQFGNKYRWIEEAAGVRLVNVRGGSQVLRVRGFAPEEAIATGNVRIMARVNGAAIGDWRLDRTGLFIVEAPVPEADFYDVELSALPRWTPAVDDRQLSVNFSSIRLVPSAGN